MLLALILPLIGEQALNITVGLFDSIMVAAVSEAAVSGVSLVDSIYVLILNIFSALSTGGVVVAGQFLGRKDPNKANKAATELMWTMMLISIFLTILLYACQTIILTKIFGKIDADVYSNARMYLLIVNLSVPFMAMYNGAAAIYRTTGNTKIIMLNSLMMGVVNIIGNAIGVYILHAGIAGVAYPTLISRALGGIFIFSTLFSKKKEISVEKTLKHHFDLSMIKNILRIGIPSGLESSMFQVGKIMLLSLIATFGTASITANSVGFSIVGVADIPGFAISLALVTVVARCVGANDYKQAVYYTNKMIIFTYIAMLVTKLSLVFALPSILKIYHLSDVTSDLAYTIIFWHSVVGILMWPIAFDLPSTFRAAGDVKFPMIISTISMYLCRLVVGYVLAVNFHMGVFGTWIGMFVDWIFRAIVFSFRYIRGKWKNFSAIR